jgi:hypothetical protein
MTSPMTLGNMRANGVRKLALLSIRLGTRDKAELSDVSPLPCE